MTKRKKAPKTTMAKKAIITKEEETVEETNVLVETDIKEEETVEETNVLVETDVKEEIVEETDVVTEQEYEIDLLTESKTEEIVTEQEILVESNVEYEIDLLTESKTEEIVTVEQKANGLKEPVQKEKDGATVDNPKITMKVGEKDKGGWLLRFREKINGKVLDLWESPGGKRWIVCNPITDRKGVDLLKTDDFNTAKLLVVKMSGKQV